MASRRQGRAAPETTAISDISSERLIIGTCIAKPSVFWDLCDRLRPQDFFLARNARVWTAMLKCGEKGKEPRINWIELHITGDREETTALGMYLEIIKNEAISDDRSRTIEAHVHSIQTLSQKRTLIAAHEEAIVSLTTSDAGTSSEVMQQMSLTAITGAMSDAIGDRYMVSYGDHADNLVKRISEDRQRGENYSRGLKPGLRAVEEVIGPLLDEKLYILGGLSGGGKTALASSIMEAAAKDAREKDLGYVYNCSMEMTGGEHVARSMAADLGLTSYKLERSQVNESEFESLTRSAEKLRKLPIMIDRYPRPTIENIRTRMLQLKHRKGLAFAVVDHILLVRFGPKDSLQERVMQVVIELKMLAGELGIPILALSQVDEKGIDEKSGFKPLARHLFGSQAIQQNADVTFFVNRPELGLKRRGPDGRTEEAKDKHAQALEKAKGKAFVYNDKGRGHGSNIEREMFFDGPTISFRDV